MSAEGPPGNSGITGAHVSILGAVGAGGGGGGGGGGVGGPGVPLFVCAPDCLPWNSDSLGGGFSSFISLSFLISNSKFFTVATFTSLGGSGNLISSTSG